MGEGSFSLGIRRGKKTNKLYLSATFSIALKKEDKNILYKIRSYLKCGQIYFNNKSVIYSVTKLKDLIEVIIPFFDLYPLTNIKKYDFEKFKIICYKMWKGEGHKRDGMSRILSIREQMNNGGYKRVQIREGDYSGLL